APPGITVILFANRVLKVGRIMQAWFVSCYLDSLLKANPNLIVLLNITCLFDPHIILFYFNPSSPINPKSNNYYKFQYPKNETSGNIAYMIWIQRSLKNFGEAKNIYKKFG